MDWICKHLRAFGQRPAFVCDGQATSYDDFVAAVDSARGELAAHGVPPGGSVAVIGDYSPPVAALLFALVLNSNILVPLTRETSAQHARFFDLADVSHSVAFDGGRAQWAGVDGGTRNALVDGLRAEGEAGLVLFTSGSTGLSKGSLLKLSALLERYRDLPAERQRPMRAAVFLKLDHIGGLNTLFATLFNGGTAIPQNDRSAEAVCRAVARDRIELLPTTPTFLNMLLFSNLHRAHDLSSLKLITYGTEPMPLSTLKSITQVFPSVRFKQTYGSTELGIFPTQSESSSSIWLKIVDNGEVATQVRNGTLWVKARTAMLGYLNAPSPFDADGWYDTGDQVEVKGEYLRILGRQSELINVGGEKVFPAEVESVLLEVPNVREVVVYGKASPVTGNIVAAVIQLHEPEGRASLQQRIAQHCAGRLQDFKIPKFISIADKSLVSNRLKKTRNVA